MAELLAKSATWGLKAETAAGISLRPLEGRLCHLIAHFPRKRAEVEAALALDWPVPGRVALRQDGAALVWAGRDEAWLYDAMPPDLAGLAAVIAQSGATAGFMVEGEKAAALLARLLPLDLRLSAFPAGAVARSLAGHIPVLIWRKGADAFELHAPRSMGQNLWHDLSAALRKLAARG